MYTNLGILVEQSFGQKNQHYRPKNETDSINSFYRTFTDLPRNFSKFTDKLFFTKLATELRPS